MNAKDVLSYGHAWVHKHLAGLTNAEMESPGVCGVWSVKEIIAHLSSFEVVLVELLEEISGSGRPTPTLDQFRNLSGDDFNAIQVYQRREYTPQETIEDYNRGQAQVMTLIEALPVENLRRVGSLPWYGETYDLEDFLVYTFYGHKREHMAQIAIYRDELGK